MSSITSNGKIHEIKKTMEFELNNKKRDAVLCVNGKIYIQNEQSEWVSKDNFMEVQKYGNFLPIQEAFEQAEKLFQQNL